MAGDSAPARKSALSSRPMFDVVLHQPEIAPNTGNLMRLTVNTQCRLHLIEPLGFSLDEARVRRAGLDYREYAEVVRHPSWERFLAAHPQRRVFAYSQHADRRYTDVEYQPGDVLVFGKESTGLPDEVLRHQAVRDRLRIPIAPRGRSLNLANAVAVVVYEAWRQQQFRLEGE